MTKHVVILKGNNNNKATHPAIFDWSWSVEMPLIFTFPPPPLETENRKNKTSIFHFVTDYRNTKYNKDTMLRMVTYFKLLIMNKGTPLQIKLTSSLSLRLPLSFTTSITRSRSS